MLINTTTKHSYLC